LDIVKLFIDETIAILNEKNWEIDTQWLLDELAQTPNVNKYISVFVRIHNLSPNLPFEKVKENFGIFRNFLRDVREEKFKELLGMRYDPRLYMSNDELVEHLASKLEDKLNKEESAEDTTDLLPMMNLLSGLQPQKPRLHEYAKRKKLKK